ncbi:hypothetical protein BO79DRAFT_153951 [Aspergillus costaricaensis CBS 115574]|uniref:Uncharacterized protein n=1 Tax=Aspergillus costaricaensis CBS 115574 TaxID=1448317 RepID=A0ACD1I7S6_9EURO|nr:hypothetical protein BO79DRAFT_153951 [Aspergillus costaricaensis CBS 115574]RAK86382.1 hypothetical protein BO79DRAFT_153951 [Aspergillus costaricaensis CBS 115574]
MTGIVDSALAEQNMTPDYEIRLLLNPAKVLNPENELMGTVLSTFGIPSTATMPQTATKLNVQFLDTCSKEIYTAGWSIRIRKAEGDDKFELNYKRRYAITGGDIDTALTIANNDGFNTGTTNYEAQVEWGYEKQTLSISRKKRAASDDSGTDLPGIIESRRMLIDEAPDRFNNFKFNEWGTEAIAVSRIFGPVLFSRYIGSWKRIPLYIEVWPLLNSEGTDIEHSVEASFKTKDRATASTGQETLVACLKNNGWFLAKDSLKTKLIMERY